MRLINISLCLLMAMNLWQNFNWPLCILLFIDIVMHAVLTVRVRKMKEKYVHVMELNHKLTQRIKQYEKLQDEDMQYHGFKNHDKDGKA